MSEMHQSPVRANMQTHTLTTEQRQYFAAHHAVVAERVLILGELPLIRNNHGGVLTIGDLTILNSDHVNSNTPIPTPVKFVLGQKASINIGNNCDLNGSSITAYRSVTIGNRVQIGAAGLITDTDLHPLDPALRRDQIEGRPYPIDAVQKAPIVIEDDVWLGYGVLVLKGVRIGQGSIIGAGSVVTQDIQARCVAAGNPAKFIKPL